MPVLPQVQANTQSVDVLDSDEEGDEQDASYMGSLQNEMSGLLVRFVAKLHSKRV